MADMPNQRTKVVSRTRRWIVRSIALGAVSVVALGLALDVSVTLGPNTADFGTVALAFEDGSSADEGVAESGIIDTNATLAGISWNGQQPDAAWVRARGSDGHWTDWIEIEIDEDHGPDRSTEEYKNQRFASDPVYFGPANALQFRVVDDDPASAEISAELVETKGRNFSTLRKAKDLVGRVRLSFGSDADAAPPGVTVVPREAWGGDACIANAKPRVLPKVHRVDTMFVHHAGNNEYLAGDDALDLVYAICSYHVNSRGWWDIAYNALIDRYGVIYEGRRGGLDQPIQGGHTGGFNSYSTGVAMLGNFQEGYTGADTPPEVMQQALVDFATWKLDLHNLDPTTSVVLESLGSTKYEEGILVTMPRLAGHRDASATACPGSFCYPLLPDFRSAIAAWEGPRIWADFSAFDPIAGDQSGYTPGTLKLTFPESSDWTMTITQRLGDVVFTASGSGTSADVVWDGKSDGVPVEPGPYDVAVEIAGATPVSQTIQLGTYSWPFIDDEGSYATDNIESLWNRGLTEGCTWNTFCIDEQLTRGELATFVARAMDAGDGNTTYSGYFPDVPEWAWYTPWVEFLHDEGILEVEEGQPFDPLGGGTRAMAVVYVLRAIDVSVAGHEYIGYFTDVTDDLWYADYIEVAHEIGIALGYGDGTFIPEGILSRQESAAFLMRALE